MLLAAATEIPPTDIAPESLRNERMAARRRSDPVGNPETLFSPAAVGVFSDFLSLRGIAPKRARHEHRSNASPIRVIGNDP